MKNYLDFKKKFNKGAKLPFEKTVDENGVVSKWVTAQVGTNKVICKPDQKVDDKSLIREIKPGTWIIDKVYTRVVVFTA